MTAKFEYRLLYSRGSKPQMTGPDLHIELETTGVPPGGVRWEFSTVYRPSKACYRDVLLQKILEMCSKHNFTALDIRQPKMRGNVNFVDVIFAAEDEVLKVYDRELSFDFYGTQPKVVDRGICERKHVALCIQTLPSDSCPKQIVDVIKANPRIRRAGQVVDVWALHRPESRRFKGRVLVLLELHTQNGVVTLETRNAIPGWFVMNKVAYLVCFPDRPTSCFHCRYDETGSFHSHHACPAAPCSCCKKKDHAAVACPKRQAQISKKKKVTDKDEDEGSSSDEDDDHDHTPRAASKGDRALMERRFAELGMRDGSEEAEELARDFGVLALSEDDIGN
ncbi:hypothetical protein NDA16_001097 [Ustilago loliicola]|nr:hypothetical protein NDA16_001097 [Ustilago loliicola]